MQYGAVSPGLHQIQLSNYYRAMKKLLRSLLDGGELGEMRLELDRLQLAVGELRKERASRELEVAEVTEKLTRLYWRLAKRARMPQDERSDIGPTQGSDQITAKVLARRSQKNALPNGRPAASAPESW